MTTYKQLLEHAGDDGASVQAPLQPEKSRLRRWWNGLAPDSGGRILFLLGVLLLAPFLVLQIISLALELLAR